MNNSQMLKGVLEGCILSLIKNKEAYTYEIVSGLKENGFVNTTEGTVYPLVLRLEKKGYISATLKATTIGPKRKYYYITEEGEEYLKQFVSDYRELNASVLRIIKGDL